MDTLDQPTGAALHIPAVEVPLPAAATAAAAVVFEAAKRGHIHLLEYFYDHDIGHCGCEEDIRMHVINYAARCGLLELLKRFAECNDGRPLDMPNAIDHAASCGHLHVVNCTADCSAATAIRVGARNGHLETVQLLCEDHQHCEGENIILAAVHEAASSDHLEIIKPLHSKLEPGQSAYPAAKAAAQGFNPKIVQYLCENQQFEAVCFLKQAIAGPGTSGRIIRCLWEHSSVKELNEAKRYATGLQKPAIALGVAQHIQAMRRTRRC